MKRAFSILFIGVGLIALSSYKGAESEALEMQDSDAQPYSNKACWYQNWDDEYVPGMGCYAGHIGSCKPAACSGEASSDIR